MSEKADDWEKAADGQECMRQAAHWLVEAVPKENLDEAVKRLLEIYQFYKEGTEK